MTTPHADESGAQAGTPARPLGDTIQEGASRVAEGQLGARKEQATGALGEVAEALRKSGQHLRDSRQDRIAELADSAARQVDSLASAVRDSSARDLLRKGEDLARREPGLFLGGAFLLGLLGARFLKSSERQSIRRPLPRFDGLRAGTSDVDADTDRLSRTGTLAGGAMGGVDLDEAGTTGVPPGFSREH